MLNKLLFVAILILLNAFFASSEIALISLNDNKVRLQAENGDKKARLILNLLKEPSRFLATIQIGITLAGFLASAFASESFADRLVDLVKSQGIPVAPSLLKPAAVIIITMVLSYFTLVLGELVPKRIAMQNPEKISRFSARPLTTLSYITSPFVKLLTISTNFFIRLLGGNPHAYEENVTEEEIRMMVDVGKEKGTIQEIERELIHNIFDFDDKDASDIMTHRIDLAAVPVSSSFDEIMDFMNREKYTRIPVYEGSIDNIIGVLHVKDLIKYTYKNNYEDKFDIMKIIREPYFIPESKKIDDLFKEFQKSKNHMAVVIDEYGGTAGIITVEDLLEEIVGNIFDEYDEKDYTEYEKLGENTFMFKGSISLDRVAALMDTDLPTEEYDTLSGYIVGQLGRIPNEGEKLTVEIGTVEFRVEEIHEKRISKVKAGRA